MSYIFFWWADICVVEEICTLFCFKQIVMILVTAIHCTDCIRLLELAVLTHASWGRNVSSLMSRLKLMSYWWCHLSVARCLPKSDCWTVAHLKTTQTCNNCFCVPNCTVNDSQNATACSTGLQVKVMHSCSARWERYEQIKLEQGASLIWNSQPSLYADYVHIWHYF